MVRAIVVGAGVVGASVAYGLATRGVDVTVLEAAYPAAGTTSNSFAWANANEKTPREYFDLNYAGLNEHRRLAAEIGGGWFHPSGNLEIASSAERRGYLKAKVKRLRSWGYRAETIAPVDAIAMAPDLSSTFVEAADLAYFDQEGWVAAPVLVSRLLHAARLRGARVVYPCRVTGLDRIGDRIAGVVCEVDRYSADVVVDCAGPAAGRLIEVTGRIIGRQRSPGLLFITNDVACSLDRIVHLEDVYLRPDGAGRFRLGAVDIDEELPRDETVSIDSPRATLVLSRAARAIPALKTARIESIKLGWRPMPTDGLSAVGPVSGIEGYYVVFTHSGVTLGPILGSLVSDEIANGVSRPELASFRPYRIVRAV